MMPTWRTVGLLAAASFIPLAFPEDRALAVWLYGLGLVVLLFLGDWLVAWRTPVDLKRDPVDLLVQGRAATVAVHLVNRRRRRVLAAWRDTGQAAFGLESEMKPVLLGPAESKRVTYEVVPAERGLWRLGDLYARRAGPLRLAWHQWRVPAGQPVKVYPDLQALARRGSLVLATRELAAGVRRARFRGLGTEFESLREFMPDDSYRTMNWNATARRGKLVANVYQTERSQTLMLMVDAGRLLVPKAGAMGTKLDYTVEAALSLATLGLRFDDRVGLLVFADRPLAYVPPARGRDQVYRLAEALYQVKPRLVEPDYEAALEVLRARLKRRSLVCLFSDLLDPEASRRVLVQTARLSPRHLPLFVALRDPAVMAEAGRDVERIMEAYTRAMAVHQLERRETALAALRERGGLALDVLPEELNSAVLNQYLEVKARALL